jgi:DNA processing protein
MSVESEGPNNLLKMGAKAVTVASDILDDLNITPIELPPDLTNLTPLERKLLELMNFEPVSSDELTKLLESDAGTVTATLTFLEMKGKIRNLGAGQYVRTR